MRHRSGRWRRVAAALAVFSLATAPTAVSQQQPAATSQAQTLSVEETLTFLRTADVVRSRPIGRGITRPWRLTLSDGRLTHDAAFNVVDERKTLERFQDGTFEANFVDSYKYNVAAFKLAELLGLRDLVPPVVERRWAGRIGSLSWWVDDTMTEGDRLEQRLSAPDTEDWNRQIFRVRLFRNLIYETDPNLGNMLIDHQWHVWLIDFTRAFRNWRRLPAESDLERGDRALIERLRGLTVDEVRAETEGYLDGSAVEAFMARRDLIVAHFDRLVAERGAEAVLY